MKYILLSLLSVSLWGQSAIGINGNVFDSNGIQLPGASQPTCSSTIAGKIWYSGHTTGVQDSAAICLSDASNTYAWRYVYGTLAGSPDMTISSSHVGTFTQGQTDASYSLTASNAGTVITSGTVTAVDTLPTGLTASAIAGTGWSCTLGTLTCTRSDALAVNGAYPPIVVTVTVASNAPANVTNVATVSGGGESNTVNNTSSNGTAISGMPDLTITKTHSGNFTQSQTGATYTIIVTNSGTGTTNGTVTVTDTVPTGLTATGIAGTGWTCTASSGPCTRADALGAGASYPAITLTVNVSGSASSSVTNTATVAGGGETNTSNDSVSNVTTVAVASDIPVTDNFNTGSLNGMWTLVAPAGGSTSQTGTKLSLVVPAAANHDSNFASTDNTVRIKQTVGQGDFTAIAKFDTIPSSQYQLEGIVARVSDSNFVRLSIESNGSGVQTNLTTVVSNTATQIASTSITGASGSIWLRLQRAGSLWTQSYSIDGTAFTTVGSVSQAYTIAELDLWAGNYNATSASAPAWTAQVDSFVSTAGGGTPSGSPAGPHTNSGPITLTSADNGRTIENVHYSSSSGPCVTTNGASNVTFHNVEVGPCGEQGFVLSGGTGIKILDSYIHNNTACIVNGTACGAYDSGDNILCSNSTGFLFQGNVMTYPETAVEAVGCSGGTFKGNFVLNPINATDRGNRGSAFQGLDNTFNTLIDSNYVLAITTTTNGVTPTYATYNGDLINFGEQNGNNRNDAQTVTHNYVQGGNFAYGCGINFDGGANIRSTSATSYITYNTMIDTQQCPISIEGGYNYTIGNNKVLNRSSLATVAYQTFACYDYQGGTELGQCSGGQFLPCGNITFSNNLGYSNSGSPYYAGNGNTGNACTSVTGAANGSNGNVWDSGGQGSAYNAMVPVATNLPPPAIPPVPSSCVAVSPLSNNTAYPPC